MYEFGWASITDALFLEGPNAGWTTTVQVGDAVSISGADL